MAASFKGFFFVCVFCIMILESASDENVLDPRTISEPLSLVYMNKALTLEAPDLDYTSPSALSCARECLADNLCQGFALFRNIDPAAGTGVNCRRYNQLDSIAYDENSVTFFTLNNTLPIP